jgi:hypothetical protein
MSSLKPFPDTSRVNERKNYDDELVETQLSSFDIAPNTKSIHVDFDYGEPSIIEDESEVSYTESKRGSTRELPEPTVSPMTNHNI